MEELINTSASKGLESGKYGFCTVARTKNISATLLKKLEATTNYKWLYEPGNKDNPIIFSHLLLDDINGRRHVLTRTSDAGLDYSQRSNKITHHLILSDMEYNNLRKSNPVDFFLTKSELFRTNWKEEPRYLDKRPLPTLPQAPASKKCLQWQACCGNPGWGGVLAYYASVNKPIILYYNLNQPFIKLIKESFALLPDSGWNISFCSYHFENEYPSSVRCQLSGVIKNSQDETSMRNRRDCVQIDLTALGPINIENDKMRELVEFARSGEKAAIPAVSTKGKKTNEETSEEIVPAVSTTFKEPTGEQPVRPDRLRPKTQNSNDDFFGDMGNLGISTRTGQPQDALMPYTNPTEFPTGKPDNKLPPNIKDGFRKRAKERKEAFHKANLIVFSILFFTLVVITTLFLIFQGKEKNKSSDQPTTTNSVTETSENPGSESTEPTTGKNEEKKSNTDKPTTTKPNTEPNKNPTPKPSDATTGKNEEKKSNTDKPTTTKPNTEPNKNPNPKPSDATTGKGKKAPDKAKKAKESETDVKIDNIYIYAFGENTSDEVKAKNRLIRFYNILTRGDVTEVPEENGGFYAYIHKSANFPSIINNEKKIKEKQDRIKQISAEIDKLQSTGDGGPKTEELQDLKEELKNLHPNKTIIIILPKATTNYKAFKDIFPGLKDPNGGSSLSYPNKFYFIYTHDSSSADGAKKQFEDEKNLDKDKSFLKNVTNYEFLSLPLDLSKEDLTEAQKKEFQTSILNMLNKENNLDKDKQKKQNPFNVD